MKRTWIATVSFAAMLTVAGVSALAEETTEGAFEEAPVITQEDGEAHLMELDGTYVPLFDVLLQDTYGEIWTESAAQVVGEADAADAVEMLQASVTGDLIGEEAAEQYGYFGDSGEGYAFYCGFTQDVAQIVIDQGTITTLDQDGNELSSHSYQFAGYDEGSGFYNYETTDEDAGEFSYFCFGFDSPEETYHIEFRYGSDLADLNSWVSGDYAYWMASGTLTGENQPEMAEASIRLFVEENLAG